MSPLELIERFFTEGVDFIAHLVDPNGSTSWMLVLWGLIGVLMRNPTLLKALGQLVLRLEKRDTSPPAAQTIARSSNGHANGNGAYASTTALQVLGARQTASDERLGALERRLDVVDQRMLRFEDYITEDREAKLEMKTMLETLVRRTAPPQSDAA